jgi:AraC-like DNA-binding protein
MAAALRATDRFYRARTRDVPRGERFDHWRALHPMIGLDPFDRDTAKDFDGERLDCTSAEGITFGFTRSASVIAHFGTKGSDTLLLGRVVKGESEVQVGSQAPSTLSDEGFSLLDHRRAYSIVSPETHAHLYLILPRRMVVNAIGEDPLSGHAGSRTLARSPLLELLWSHMQKLAEVGESLNTQGTAVAMKAAADLALTGLAQMGRNGARDVQGRAEEALVASAERIIRLRCSDSALTADAVAASVGVSRAHLYRAFAARGLAIGDVIREARLGEARRLLSAPHHRVIGEIAHQAGYEDAAAFSRAFRRRFGLSPRDWVAALRERA